MYILNDCYNFCLQVHHAIYLKNLTIDELKEKLIEAFGINGIYLKNIFLFGPNGIKIQLTNSVIQNMKNESIYNCNVEKGMNQLFTCFQCFLNPLLIIS